MLTSVSMHARDSLKVHVFGFYFKNEEFEFASHGKLWKIKTEKGLNAFAFYIELPDSIKDGSILPLDIYKKSKWGSKYKWIHLEPLYQSDRKYFTLVRDFRVKDKYALIEEWHNYPFNAPEIIPEFWSEPIIPDWAKVSYTKY